MTAAAATAERQPPDTSPAGSVSWRGLMWVAWRQHRTALTVFVTLISVVAIALAATGFALHPVADRVFSAGPNSPWHLYDVTDTLLRIMLPLIPMLAGLFLGAPLVAREIETGTTRFAWAQGAGRTRWLIATVIQAVVMLAVIAIALGLEFRWWETPMPFRWAWRPDLFGLNPLPYTGWFVFGFSLGVVLGAAIRRTVPAIAATLACYLPLPYLVARSRFFVYLPPLHRAAQTAFRPGGGYSTSMYWGNHSGPGPDRLSTALGWPDGRLLTSSELHHSAAWFRLHHIQVWLTYQPGSRFLLFEYIEFGWLVALSAILIGVTVVLIRSRAA